MDCLWNWQWKSIFTSEYSWWNQEIIPCWARLDHCQGGLPAFPALPLVQRELLGTVRSHFKSREQNNHVKEVFWNLFSSYASFFGELFVHPIKLIPSLAQGKLTKGKIWQQAVDLVLPASLASSLPGGVSLASWQGQVSVCWPFDGRIVGSWYLSKVSSRKPLLLLLLLCTFSRLRSFYWVVWIA